jgi:hypothetical protein
MKDIRRSEESGSNRFGFMTLIFKNLKTLRFWILKIQVMAVDLAKMAEEWGQISLSPKDTTFSSREQAPCCRP